MANVSMLKRQKTILAAVAMALAVVAFVYAPEPVRAYSGGGSLVLRRPARSLSGCSVGMTSWFVDTEKRKGFAGPSPIGERSRGFVDGCQPGDAGVEPSDHSNLTTAAALGRRT